MRDRLIELLQQADKRCNDTKQCENCVGFGKGSECVNHLIADHLLSEGVIVPPCKVGDEVYWIGNRERIVKTYYVACVEINIFADHTHTVIHTKINKDNFYSDGLFSNYQFGKYLFFTKEEAERALERSENA